MRSARRKWKIGRQRKSQLYEEETSECVFETNTFTGSIKLWLVGRNSYAKRKITECGSRTRREGNLFSLLTGGDRDDTQFVHPLVLRRKIRQDAVSNQAAKQRAVRSSRGVEFPVSSSRGGRRVRRGRLSAVFLFCSVVRSINWSSLVSSSVVCFSIFGSRRRMQSAIQYPTMEHDSLSGFGYVRLKQLFFLFGSFSF